MYRARPSVCKTWNWNPIGLLPISSSFVSSVVNVVFFLVAGLFGEEEEASACYQPCYLDLSSLSLLCVFLCVWTFCNVMTKTIYLFSMKIRPWCRATIRYPHLLRSPRG